MVYMSRKTLPFLPKCAYGLKNSSPTQWSVFFFDKLSSRFDETGGLVQMVVRPSAGAYIGLLPVPRISCFLSFFLTF